jgi:hypothetical protein
MARMLLVGVALALPAFSQCGTDSASDGFDDRQGNPRFAKSSRVSYD